VITHVGLLRAINVGGNNILPMADLVKIYTAAGAKEVSTYIQSGNVLFSASAAVAKQLPAKITAALAKRDMKVPVVQRTAAELAAVVKDNPFLRSKTTSLERLYVAFLGAAPDAKAIASIDPQRSPGDEHAIIGSHVFLHLNNGAGGTKLTVAYLDKQLATTSTVRNWQTVLKLHALVTASAKA